MFGYGSYRTAAFVSRRLPILFAYWFGMRVADLFYLSDARGRNGVQANLRRILAHRGVRYGPSSIRVLSRKTYQHFGKYLIDFFRYSASTFAEIEDRLDIERIDHLDRVYAGGRGLILLTAHVGNWEMGALALCQKGYPLTAVFRPEGVRQVDRLFEAQRRSRGLSLVPIGGAARGMLRALRDGGIVALLADRDFTTHRHHARFFGADACLPRGPAQLAVRTGVPIVPAFMIRRVDDRFVLRFSPPIMPDGDVDEVQERIAAILEQVIGENPFQWFVFEDFWAAAAAGAPGAGPGGDGS
jgi:KDO2-lipid IV(A) lauroyltransferase